MQEGPSQWARLEQSSRSSAELHAFNYRHPLYGKAPVSLLVSNQRDRRTIKGVVCHSSEYEYPQGSFYQLRSGLYLASPELAFARMGLYLDDVKLMQLGLDLCGRYFVRLDGEIENRPRFVTTPKALAGYLAKVCGMRGASKAARALSEVLPNSGSPLESMMKLQFCLPMRKGGFNLPFTHMNYDVSAGRLSSILDQNRFSLDLANPQLKVAVEYDGLAYHQDASRDKRRRNELAALGWQVFPLDAKVLFDPQATVRMGEQLARRMGVRLRYPAAWERAFVQMRTSLELPV